MNKLKELFLGLLIAGLAFAGNPGIVESLANGKEIRGREFLSLELKGQQVATPSYSITWRLNNIIGYTSIGVDYISVSSGNATTLSMQPIFSTGENAGSAGTLTAGTDFTDIDSAFYDVTYYSNVAITTNVTINFNIAD